MDPSAQRSLNRVVWREVNAQFTDAAAEAAWRDDALTWGLFGIPDVQLGVLGEVAGLDIVEVGCGTAYVSARLARRGARVLGVDLSPEQLATAKHCQDVIGPRFPLVEADGDVLPMADASVDLLISEHGAAAWCDPQKWVAEAARVLRPSGRLAYLTNSLLCALCVPADEGLARERLLRAQRDVATVAWPGGGVEHHPSHGDWIRLLTSNGFVIDAMHELYAPQQSADPPFYGIVSADWAKRWPAEELWVAHKSA